MATARRPRSNVVVLHRVPYKLYAKLCETSESGHVRMTYHDGTLEIVSPVLYEHEFASSRFRLIVGTVAESLGLVFQGADSTTFRRSGVGVFEGKGKEPDQSFYISSIGRLPKGRNLDLDAGDPPPDLWIEVDHRASSAGRLPVYAGLGVPEVWRYRTRRKKLQFLGLVGDSYEPIDRSLCLPVLTPALVLEALALGDDRYESEWLPLLREWVARTIRPGQG